ncbi:hypothetical protein CAEBREN_08654 [Caenorhabditis brenneri]|uniref:Uncharacterized protein n=1 Tax=Caenorhabditis brenneri TaxID=135651 RepID=G0M7U0_CAEBE|nr:hypothetical protein CAEBREN_08654 [Caenorhabditis brenneri]
MNTVSLALFLLFTVSMVQGLTLVIKKNRKYNDPPFCYAYNREYNENDVTSSCSGYQFDCFDQSGAQIGATVQFNKADCESMAIFRSFSDADFQKRLDEASKYATGANN